jgi:hypothetical protein
LSAASLSELLGGQPSWLASAPAGLLSTLGVGTAERPTIPRPVVATQPARQHVGWLKWAVPLAIVAVVAGARSCGSSPTESSAVGIEILVASM